MIEISDGGGAINGLRKFIADVDKAGDLKRIRDEVDWKYELGAITKQAQLSQENRPALLFEKIKDYRGWRVFANALNSHARIAIALGLEPATPFTRIVEIFRQRIKDVVEPVFTGTSPVAENALTGAEVDLEKLPVPWFSREDGGRYIGTWHLNISRDPETGSRNLGVYRMQLLGPRKTAVSISPGSHLAVHLTKARQKGRALEMAVAIGVDETLIMAAAASLPYGVDECCAAGGLSGDAVALSKCATIDLEVPADAEIVLEGKIDPNLRIEEGPFLDYTGIPKGDPGGFVFEVSCLMYRDKPIFRGAAIGSPGGEDHVLFSLLSLAGSLDFHGSRIKQKIQNYLVKRGSYGFFQYAGRLRR